MVNEEKLSSRSIIYKSEIRYHNPTYPYKFIVEFDERTKEIIICHYSINKQKITHSIGIDIGDLEKILNNIKK